MKAIWVNFMIMMDEKGNYYEELNPDETIPLEAYVWFFNRDKPLNEKPFPSEKISIQKIEKILERYKKAGFLNAIVKFFLKIPPLEEECNSPGCKRRMKNVGQACYWCGRLT